MKITGRRPDTTGFSHNGQAITLVDGIAEVDTETGVWLIQAGLADEYVEPELPVITDIPTEDTEKELQQADEAAVADTNTRRKRR